MLDPMHGQICECSSIRTISSIRTTHKHSLPRPPHQARFPNLENISVDQISSLRFVMTQLTDSQARQILDACPLLKKVYLVHSRVSYEIPWVVERHSASLECLQEGFA
ncbi:hypothetical protein BGZ83_009762 [Gryganskiella cystojenkinii]|nr:hypothetical protein BGZ83_009762 [Gryganskiella cystojenkinii]